MGITRNGNCHLYCGETLFIDKLKCQMISRGIISIPFSKVHFTVAIKKYIAASVNGSERSSTIVGFIAITYVSGRHFLASNYIQTKEIMKH